MRKTYLGNLKIIYKHYVKASNGTRVIGLFLPTKKTIYVSTSIGKCEQFIVLIHEIGHYIMHLLGFRTNGAFIYDALWIILEPPYVYKYKIYTIRWLYKHYYGKKR